MDTVYTPAAVTALLLLLAFFVWTARRRRRTPRISVRPREVLTAAQQRLYRTLCAGLPNHYVLAQVPFAAFLEPRGQGQQPPVPLSGQWADFLICDQAFRVIAVVELGAGQRSAQHDELLRDAALPLIRWQDNALPDASEVRETVRDLESLRTLGEQVGDPEPGPGSAAADPMDADDAAAGGGRRREPHL
ncbi:DUF2726 domain-containing protein [Aquisalimonas lutea]|uniref:DUF2726 domain-containing protein n=1 Tax=Aquisalimonas lutea TaxID=1327750 RepID=UPI0025B2A577|nr:DUF2726 domain-containing protein [Aquisalimonas lutea]MDN3516162.1 DUF2726 domain-containing protein [Aquisalimonas lutea]